MESARSQHLEARIDPSCRLSGQQGQELAFAARPPCGDQLLAQRSAESHFVVSQAVQENLGACVLPPSKFFREPGVFVQPPGAVVVGDH